jgi:hypothetical protein
MILQGFDVKKMTGKASEALQQGFRELELLDEITRLYYESKLPKMITEKTRNSLIHTHRFHKGPHYVPACVHQSIRWNKDDPMLAPIKDDDEWKIVKQTRKTTINNSMELITLTIQRSNNMRVSMTT